MDDFIYDKHHLRYNPLQDNWIMVCPGRLKRPWQTQTEEIVPAETLPPYDENCYMCPGNLRSGGIKNPDYKGVFVFDNDFPSLTPSIDKPLDIEMAWKRAKTERGFCKVICYTKNHNKTFVDMASKEIESVINVWITQIEELKNFHFIHYVQIFENRGGVGNSNPHPHGQIWATESIPNEIRLELKNMQFYKEKHNNCLLCDVLLYEKNEKERVVFESDFFIVFVPFWATWPFETIVIPKRHRNCLTNLDKGEIEDLSPLLRRIMSMYDTLFNVIMPLSYGFHIIPKKTDDLSSFHMHIHFYPLLLRSAKVRKFMAGFEMLASPQRDITPEFAAITLRSISDKINCT
mgnify:CR=1 FL=1